MAFPVFDGNIILSSIHNFASSHKGHLSIVASNGGH